MRIPMDWLLAYLIAANLIAVCVTVVDKHRARRKHWRIAESTLLWVAVLGGALLMLLTMRLIRHKTQHRKFMWGLPIILLLQGIVLAFLVAKGFVGQ